MVSFPTYKQTITNQFNCVMIIESIQLLRRGGRQVLNRKAIATSGVLSSCHTSKGQSGCTLQVFWRAPCLVNNLYV